MQMASIELINGSARGIVRAGPATLQYIAPCNTLAAARPYFTYNGRYTLAIYLCLSVAITTFLLTMNHLLDLCWFFLSSQVVGRTSKLQDALCLQPSPLPKTRG